MTLSISKLAISLSVTIFLSATVIAPANADNIRVRNINGYTTIDNRHIILNGGASRHYLVTLRSNCMHLNWGGSSHVGRFPYTIGTSFASTATIRSPQFEFITVGDGNRCYIKAIEEVENKDTALQLIADRAEDTDENNDS
jgi:hypothetical protein